MRRVTGLTEARQVLERWRSGQGDLPPAVREGLRRAFGEDLSPQEAVERILRDVRERGDAAVRDYTLRLEGRGVEALEVPRERWREARRGLPRPLLRALETAARRVRAFHQRALPRSWFDPGEGYGHLALPVERVGIYVPGGTASYPSTLLMTAIPARVAGVREVVVATPAWGDGGPPPAVLAAAEMAGVDRLFQMGGAQAIAALAYGTETVPRVDFLCGPGNLFVTLAKRMVFGTVGIDTLAGPSEAVVVADDTADPALCAADLLAQAEHDPLAVAVLVTPSRCLLDRVETELDRQARDLPRREVVRRALEGQALGVLVGNLEEAMEVVALMAPEHTSLLVRDPWALVPRVRHTGALFLGPLSAGPLGDYVAGPSHVLPTGGWARFSSGLGVHHFLRLTPVVALGADLFRALAGPAITLARAEGLEGHAWAVEARRRRSRRRRTE